jgi:hypothetical protein
MATPIFDQNSLMKIGEALASAYRGMVSPDISPPSAPKPPAAPNVQAAKPNPSASLQEVLSNNPGLAKVFNSQNTSVVFASPERIAALKKAGRGDEGLEYWPTNEQGNEAFPRPPETTGKHVLEIYDPKLMSNTGALNDAIYGDLLHGMEADPYYASLKKQFVDNYTPKTKSWEAKRHKENTETKDEAPWATDDMYIRGKLAKGQGEEWDEPGRYSPKQLEILKEMQRYLSTGTPAPEKSEQPATGWPNISPGPKKKEPGNIW